MGAPTPDDKLNTLSEFSAECAMAKVYTSEAYNELADEALQVFGGYGFSEEYPPARMYRIRASPASTKARTRSVGCMPRGRC